MDEPWTYRPPLITTDYGDRPFAAAISPLQLLRTEPAQKVYYLWLTDLDGRALPALSTPPEVAAMGYERILIWWDAYTATQDIQRRTHPEHPVTVHRMVVKKGQCFIDPNPVPAEDCQPPERWQGPFDLGPLRGYVAAHWSNDGTLHLSMEFMVTESWHGEQVR